MKPLAIVTGGTQGIGLACCEALVAQGYAVIAAARRAVAVPAGVEFVACDVADAAAVQALFARAEGLRVLVHAAGIAGADPAQDAEAHWRRMMAVNLDGAWRCAAAAARCMPDGGRIIAIASVLGLRAVPDQVAYTAAKHGVVGMVRAMALKHAARGITVNAICPGWVRTPMAEARWRELGMTEADAAAATPSGRVTTPAEVAALAVYLASDAAANLTGQAITLDGGG